MTDLSFQLNWPILLYSFEDSSAEKNRRLKEISGWFKSEDNRDTIHCHSFHDFFAAFRSRQDIAAIFIEYTPSSQERIQEFHQAMDVIEKHNKKIPIVAFSEERNFGKLAIKDVERLSDILFLYADTPDFIADRLLEQAGQYVDSIVPPFLKSSIKYSQAYKYAWHTPGHMGGEAFLKSPPGKVFYDFLGENVFRSDLSISVPELGSLLDHEGPVRDAESFAAKVFGADQSYFVLNGTSSVNQIIWCARVTRDDLAFVDRNCHKALNYAMVVTEATPIYMLPRRNYLGIIGPVKLTEFTGDYIERAKENHPLIKGEQKKQRVKMSALTNSTYDGICYNVTTIKNTLKKHVDNLHFDEAWYAYARFHPMYENHYAMTSSEEKDDHPPIFASQSTHKLLAAFSQASMLHCKDGSSEPVDHAVFNKAYMMYGSTSPQYNMVSSLDVATGMMAFNGEELLHSTILDAIDFRINVDRVRRELEAEGSWFFGIWQPDKIDYQGETVNFCDVPATYLAENQQCWVFNKKDSWHGFKDIEENYAMLDPIKITFTMPGLDADGKFSALGIPASVLTNYLISRGVVAEKSDYYSFLILNSIQYLRH